MLKSCVVIGLLLLMGLSSSACSIPLRITTYTNPEELARQEEIRQKELATKEDMRQEKATKQKYHKMLDKHAKRLARKVAGKEKLKSESARLKEEASQERNQILNAFDKEGQLIITAFVKNDVPILEIAQELKNYGKSNFEGFIEYYFRRGYPFSDKETIIQIRGEDYLDNLWQERKAQGKIADVRKTYNLLKDRRE